MSIGLKNLQEFSSSIANLSFFDKHKEWIKQLTILEENVYFLPKQLSRFHSIIRRIAI